MALTRREILSTATMAELITKLKAKYGNDGAPIDVSIDFLDKISTLLSSGGGGLTSSENLTAVFAVGTPEENGQVFHEAYQAAPVSTENNPHIILVGPGYYDLRNFEDTEYGYLLDKDAVHIVGLASEASAFFTTLDLSTTTKERRILRNINTLEYNLDLYPAGFPINFRNNCSNWYDLYVDNCIVGEFSFNGCDAISGWYRNVKGGQGILGFAGEETFANEYSYLKYRPNPGDTITLFGVFLYDCNFAYTKYSSFSPALLGSIGVSDGTKNIFLNSVYADNVQCRGNSFGCFIDNVSGGSKTLQFLTGDFRNVSIYGQGFGIVSTYSSGSNVSLIDMSSVYFENCNTSLQGFGVGATSVSMEGTYKNCKVFSEADGPGFFTTPVKGFAISTAGTIGGELTGAYVINCEVGTKDARNPNVGPLSIFGFGNKSCYSFVSNSTSYGSGFGYEGTNNTEGNLYLVRDSMVFSTSGKAHGMGAYVNCVTAGYAFGQFLVGDNPGDGGAVVNCYSIPTYTLINLSQTQ